MVTFDNEPAVRPMSPETRVLIGAMDYEAMLRHWRWDPIGHYLFMGEAGPYFSFILARRRVEVGDSGAARASLAVGW